MSDTRICEGCNKPMLPRLHRQMRADGKKVCQECMTKGPQPGWMGTGALRPDELEELRVAMAEKQQEILAARAERNTGWPDGEALRHHLAEAHGWSPETIGTANPADHHHEHVGLHELSEMGLLTDAGHRHVRLRPVGSLQTTAHESADDLEIMHCPWCGSGQITASSDGSIVCGYQNCGRTFTVRLMPNYPAMPQSIDGEPFPPGMPGAEPGAPGDELPGEAPPGMEGDPLSEEEPFPPEEEDPAAEEEEEDDDVPAFLKGSTLRTSAGAALPYDAFLRHLAIVDSGYAELVLAQVRADAAQGDE